MLVNNIDYECHNVEFISYTGKYPCLCSGTLTLKIDGVEVKFGYTHNGEADYPPFWESGGGLDEDYCPYENKWEIDVSRLPEQYRKHAGEIDYVFNENVEHGCCGGCG